MSLGRVAAALVLICLIAGVASGATTPSGILLDTFKHSGDADDDDGAASSIVVHGNTNNGSSLAYRQPNRAGGSMLYVEPSAGGSRYAPASTILKASCSRKNPEGWAGLPLIYQGAIIGVRVTAHGTGCVGTPLVVAVDPGGGSGARFVATSTPPLPDGKKTI
jgi:hypothetical protein